MAQLVSKMTCFAPACTLTPDRLRALSQTNREGNKACYQLPLSLCSEVWTKISCAQFPLKHYCYDYLYCLSLQSEIHSAAIFVLL